MSNIYENDVLIEAMGGALHPGGLRLTSRAARLAGIARGMSVLDIGCGAGASLEYLSHELGVIPYGIDISDKLLGIAKGRVPGADLTVCDAAGLPFEDETFDAVICECTLSLFKSLTSVYGEIYRVLKPAGRLIISDVRLTMPPGFETINIEEHKAAFVTYIAEMYNALPDDDFKALLEDTSHGAANTYYLAVLAKSGCIDDLREHEPGKAV